MSEHNEADEAPSARLIGGNYLEAMQDLLDESQASKKDASPDQVLTLAMGELQALGLMAVYHELRHGHDQQARQMAALGQLVNELRLQNMKSE